MSGKWESTRKVVAMFCVGSVAIKSKKNRQLALPCLFACPSVITLEPLIEFLMKSGVAEFH